MSMFLARRVSKRFFVPVLVEEVGDDDDDPLARVP